MKWAAAIFSLGFIASNVYAAPAPGLDLFRLKIASNEQSINGRYLSSNASILGIYDSDDISPVRVYQTSSEKTGCSQLHTYPIGIVDHALALVGSNGLMALTDMVNPAGTKPDDGRAMEWDTFRVADSKLTNDGKGTWVAFPTKTSWTVKWTDGSAFMTTDYMPVEIVMEAAGEGRHNE
ncbi:hypothetical protein SAMD00023353_4000170 [Rosellinia necatrix]|uniref:Uncharacterized protein n=1 Tax=Rosellinia necatrix TaxID=77044 RepID=A0A1W2TM35_ROSNE|nr:hypothetical protein SAMD00023353_4000170 [Rosellinia necatrix]